MGIVLEEEQKGFTIIEVMLFLALSGFLLAGILAGTGASIANQRYKDAVQDAVDALRSAYSFVADTQIQPRDGKGACGGTIGGSSDGVLNDNNKDRGRTNCAVYGAVVMIDGARIQMTTVIGRDYYDFVRAVDYSNVTAGKDASFGEDLQRVLFPNSDIDLLKGLHVNNLALHCADASTCNNIEVAGGVKTLKLKWGTSFKAPRANDSTSVTENPELRLTMLIYRHPVNGSIRTISMDDTINGTDGKPIDYSKGGFTDLKSEGIYNSFGTDIAPSPLVQKDIYLCVDSDSIDSYADHRRIIKIVKNAHSQSGIVLTDMDDDVYDSDGNEVLCDDI